MKTHNVQFAGYLIGNTAVRAQKPPPLPLHRLPLARFTGSEDGLDHGYFTDRVFKRYGDLGVVAHGPGKGIALQRVLIRCWETLHRDAAEGEVASRVDEEPGGPVVGRVERNLKFNTAARAEKLNFLAWNLLRAASEHSVA